MSELAEYPHPTSAWRPGWARGRSNALADGIRARASWSLEPTSGEGFLFFSQGWTIEEHHAVSGWLRALGWDLVAVEQFSEASSDGETLIRLLVHEEMNWRNGPGTPDFEHPESPELLEQVRPAGQLPWRSGLDRR